MSRQENHDAIALVKRYRPEGDRTPPRRPSPGDETEALTRYRRLLPAMGVSRENRWSSPTEIRKGDARQGINLESARSHGFQTPRQVLAASCARLPATRRVVALIRQRLPRNRQHPLYQSSARRPPR